MSADELKELFSQPLMLFILMLVASLGSAAKQLVVARRQGAAVSVKEYFLKIETAVMLGAVGGAWLALLYTDTLNPMSALGLGYVANDAADIVTKDGRSAAIKPPGSGT